MEEDLCYAEGSGALFTIEQMLPHCYSSVVSNKYKIKGTEKTVRDSGQNRRPFLSEAACILLNYFCLSPPVFIYLIFASFPVS